MFSLESPRWGEMSHAYGPASDIPALLRQLAQQPDAFGESQPWFTLWSSLAHQGDIYSASLASVPHVVNILAAHPGSATATYFQFPAWIEICRQVSSCVRKLIFCALQAQAVVPRLAHTFGISLWSNR